ncbi:MAG: sensor histidine kinase [Blautia sp.]|nr:sensor histidine kinase [Blautia sp.]
MKHTIIQYYHSKTLAAKIRISYLILLIPVIFLLIFSAYNLWQGNRNYDTMIDSVVTASEFSLDFKKDFDYETYLLIVGNKQPEDSTIHVLLEEANRIVNELERLTDSEANEKRLRSVQKYLANLETYSDRIEENLKLDEQYEINLEIWENDVQIVTQLLQESIYQDIYYEVNDLQESHTSYQAVFATMFRATLISMILILGVIAALSYLIPRSITRPIRQISMVTDQVAKGDLSVRSDVYSGEEVSLLSDSLNVMIDKINELLQQVTAEQVRLRKAEFHLLQSQINPHFLYNTLDAIVWLAESGDQKTVVQMVGSLSEFFRTSLNQGKDIISIREELQHARSYLEIQQVRYQDILSYEIDVPEELGKYLIPKITIQPLVENALYHGIKNRRRKGLIRITGRYCEDGDSSGEKQQETDAQEHLPAEPSYFCIQVSDDGIGMEEERLKKVRNAVKNRMDSEDDVYGLYNVNERIRLNFGEACGIRIESTYMEGTTVTVNLPCITELPS